MEKVWLWCIHESANIACGDQREQRSYDVIDHVVEVEMRDTKGLLDMIHTDIRLGRFQIPQAMYRSATEAEVNEHAAKHPEVARRRRAEIRAAHKERQAQLDAQLAQLAAERERTLATLGTLGDEEGDDQDTQDKNEVVGSPAPKRASRKKAVA